MTNSIQIRDLLEMLERIEDKSARLVVRTNVYHPRGQPNWSLNESDILTVKKTLDREWSIIIEPPAGYQDGDEP